MHYFAYKVFSFSFHFNMFRYQWDTSLRWTKSIRKWLFGWGKEKKYMLLLLL